MSGSNFDHAFTHADALEQAKSAWIGGDKAEAIKGTALQRLAFAVLVLYTEMVENGEKPPALGSVMASKDARKVLNTAMVKALDIGKRNSEKSQDGAADRYSYGAKINMLRDALSLASIMVLFKVPLSAFDPKRGLWTVPREMLLKSGDTPAHELAKDANATVPLNNLAFNSNTTNAKGKAMTGDVRSSVRHVLATHTPKSGRAAGGAAGKGDKGKVVTSKELVGRLVAGDVPPLVKALVSIIDQDKNDAPGTVHFDWFKPDVWSQLQRLSAWTHSVMSHPAFRSPSDASKRAKQPKPQGKAPAARKGKAATAPATAA